MEAVSIISDLVKPLVLSGAYKDEAAALKDMVVSHIESKIEAYNKIIQTLQEKYGKDFNVFTKHIKNTATTESEDDWMEWKGAIEMKKAWNEALKEVMEIEAKV